MDTTIVNNNPVTVYNASNIDQVPDSDILKEVNETYDSYKHGRIPFERLWYKASHFLIGNHWITWDTLENQWRKRRLARFVPTPVTNKYASSGQRLVSVMARIEPNWTFKPSSDSESDIKAAEQCDSAKDIICEENHVESIRQRVAPWVTYTGNCYLLSGVEGEFEEPELPALSPMGMNVNPMLSQMEAMMSPVVKNGKLYTDVLSPYEVYLDQTVENFDDQQKILVVNRRSKEYVKLMWGQDVEDFDQDSKLNYLESLGYICPDAYTTGFVHGRQKVRRAIVKRLFMKPSEKYPEGLYVVACGDKVLEKNVLPLTKEGKPFIPIAHIPFDKVPGAALGRTPMDDVLQKNITRNKIESLIELIIFRMAAPIWLIPNGTVMHGMTGEPGSQVEYSLVGDKAAKPDRIPGEQIPSTLPMWIEKIDRDIEDLVSTFEALKGQLPAAGTPNVAIENLIEQGLTRFGPALRNMGEGWRQWMMHQLEFFRMYGQADRYLAKKGVTAQWSVQKFKGADILGAVNVKIESDSTTPRSSHIETAKTLEAVNTKLVDIADPNVRYEVLRKLKLQDLMSDVDGDKLQAVKENESMASGGEVHVTPFVDNPVIHIPEHKKAFWESADPVIKQIIAQHIAEHNMIMDAEQVPGPEGGGANQITDKKKENLNPGGEPTKPLPPQVAA